MSKHHDDGTSMNLEKIQNRLDNDDFGPEIVDIIKWLVEQLSRKNEGQSND